MHKHDSRSPSKQDIDLGFRIRKRRQDLGLSLEYVCEKISVSKEQLRKYELGRNKISAIRLGQIATLLRTTTDDLIGKISTAQCSDIDQEARDLWNRIDKLDHKKVFIAMMKLVVKNNAE